jgi:hypothetical protein
MSSSGSQSRGSKVFTSYRWIQGKTISRVRRLLLLKASREDASPLLLPAVCAHGSEVEARGVADIKRFGTNFDKLT